LTNVNLKTPPEDFSSVEKAKLSTNGLTIAVKDRNSQSNLCTQLRDTDFEELGEIAETFSKIVWHISRIQSCPAYRE
jgi:hypothetical protein